MAHVWTESRAPVDRGSTQDAGWIATEITGDQGYLSAAGLECTQPEGTGSSGVPFALLLRGGANGTERWAVVGSNRVVLNGLPLLVGIHLLKDRDQIRLHRGPIVYFSTERLARVEPFPGADRPIYCARCKSEIQKDSPAVLCPGCGVWCHQTLELPCFEYPDTATCPLCTHSNKLDSTYQWTPACL